MTPFVKRNFELSVSLFGQPTANEIGEAINMLRREAEKEFGLKYKEVVKVFGPENAPNGPYPVMTMYAYPG